MDVYSAADDCNYRRQKEYKNLGFAKAALILACDTTNDAKKAMKYATTSKEEITTSNECTKKTQQHPEKKIGGSKENAGFLIMLLYKMKTVIYYDVILLLYKLTTVI